MLAVVGDALWTSAPSNATLPSNLSLPSNVSLPANATQDGAHVNAGLLDGGLILYCGLVVLFVWRFICYWRCCGRWLQYANYCSLLLLLLLTMLCYDVYMFVQAAISKSGKSTWEELPAWLRPIILAGPVISICTYVMCAAQTFQHVERIKDESAVMRHDRAVQIILLPAVYGATAMTSLTRLYKVIIVPNVPDSEMEVQMLKGQTCEWVGDLYESWALYQFGKLSLSLIESSIAKQGQSDRPEERAAARALLVAHSAVETLAWVGILAFLVVSLVQAGWALWILIFTPADSQVDTFNSSMSQFTAAGFLASCAAIYNVYIIEDTFHRFLEPFAPFLKFLTVKVLVTFAWCQRLFFSTCRSIQASVWTSMKDVPILGDVVMMRPERFEVFYACLLIIECFFVTLIHWWAWSAKEEWYDELGSEMKDNGDGTPLSLADARSSYGSFQ